MNFAHDALGHSRAVYTWDPPISGGRRGPPQKCWWKRTPPPEVDVEEDPPLEVDMEEDPVKWW